MNKINLGKIIKAKNLNRKQVAQELFPGNKHPVMALDRVLKENSVLDADQISRFSLFTGIPISELYSGANWQSKIEGKKHVLVSGDYRAELNTDDWTTKLFHRGSIFHEFVIHSASITLGDYIGLLESEIQNQKK